MALASRLNGYMYSNRTSLSLAVFILMANHFCLWNNYETAWHKNYSMYLGDMLSAAGGCELSTTTRVKTA